MTQVSQGLLIDELVDEGTSTPTLVALPRNPSAETAPRRSLFRRHPDRQLKLVLLPSIEPEASPAPPPLMPMALAAAFGGEEAGLRSVPVVDDSLRDAMLEPGDTILLGPVDGGRPHTDGLLMALRVSGGPLQLRRVHDADAGQLRLQPEDPELPSVLVAANAVVVEGAVISIVRAPRPIG